MWYIYKHTNLVNGKVYIGQTCTKLNKRFQNGNGYKPRDDDDKTHHFWNAICKYGWENFSHEILMENIKTQEEADDAEQYYINLYDSLNREKGYNGREAGSHGKHSEESKQKNREKHLGKKASEETRKKMSEARKGKPSPLKGTRQTDETKRKKSEAMSAENNPMYGRQHSEESKRKNMLHQQRKPVFCVELNKVFESIRQAFRETGIDDSSISRACKGKVKTAGGYHWTFYEEQQVI